MFLERAEIEETILGRITSTVCPRLGPRRQRARFLRALADRAPSGRAFQRWQAAQRCLVERLAPLGADPACCGAARVLRISGTKNSKSGRTVTVVRGDGRRYRFDDLADAIYRTTGRPTRRELAARQCGAKACGGASKAVRGAATGTAVQGRAPGPRAAPHSLGRRDPGRAPEQLAPSRRDRARLCGAGR
jgi:hypothetical protein